MEGEQINNNTSTTTMGKGDAPLPINSKDHFTSLEEAAAMPSSPPKTLRLSRKSKDITKTPERNNKTNRTSLINSVTPTADWPSSSRINRVPKRTKQQQSLFAFLDNRTKSKEQLTQRPVVEEVKARRAANGKRLIPSGEQQRLLHEKAE